MTQISVIKYSEILSFSGRIDSEFYKPLTLYADQAIRKQKHQKLGSLVKDGYRVVYENTKILDRNKIKENEDVLFLQATNISNNGLWIDVKNIGFVKYSDWEKYPKGRLKIGEVLIEVKGQAEKVTIVQDYMPLRTLVTGTLFKLQLKDNIISHEYLFAFFSCKYGKILRDRSKVNTLIAYVSKPELYNIPIPIVDKVNHDIITGLIKKSFNYQRHSYSLYAEATQLLEQELGLGRISFEKPTGYVANFSEVTRNLRTDPDYYQTKYIQLENYAQNIKTVFLSSICNFQKGFEVGSSSYTKDGYLFIRVSNLTIEGFKIGNSDKYISAQTYKSLKTYKPDNGDILLTKDGTIGTCYVVDEEVEGIISSGIMKLKLKDPSIPKEYLALAINSQFCQMQAERECSGALIRHWKPEQIRKLRIPIIDSGIMSEISSLVENSKLARKESLELLEQAKNRVEELIEQSIQDNA